MRTNIKIKWIMLVIAWVAFGLFLMRGLHRFRNGIRLTEAKHHSEYWKHLAEQDALWAEQCAREAREAAAMANWEADQARTPSSEPSRQSHLREAVRWANLADSARQRADDARADAKIAEDRQTARDKWMRKLTAKLRSEW
jgi:hypothetical protein